MNKNALVIYKTQPAIIKELDGDKYIITYGKQDLYPIIIGAE